MTRTDPGAPPRIEQNSFLLLLFLLTVGFAIVVEPYFGAVFWSTVLALLFTPLYRWFLARFGARRRVWSALATLGVILVMVILPLALITVSLVQEVTGVYQRVRSGEIDFVRYFQQITAALPSWASSLMDRLGVTDLATLQDKLRTGLMQRGQALATQAVDVGQNTLDLVVGFVVAMYVLFFLLLDGSHVMEKIREAIPLRQEHKDRLLTQLAAVIRATVKGNVLVAVAQGALGGLAFWVLGVHAPILWAVVMAFLSLLPAVGAALIWAPVSIYLLATGSIWQGIALIAFGTLVIGLVDNVLRPILVGKDIKMPDYVVLVSTLGGLTVFGINGFVLGPVIVAMFILAWELMTDSRRAAGDIGDPG